MKYLKVIILLSLILSIWTSCKKDNNDLEDYLIFGAFYGECGGNCTILYKIEGEQLYTDDVEWGIPDDIPFQAAPLSSNKYEIAKILIDEFPDELKNASESVFGCPDCADQGGYFIELKDGESIKSWTIDTSESEIPDYLVPYTQKIWEVLLAL